MCYTSGQSDVVLLGKTALRGSDIPGVRLYLRTGHVRQYHRHGNRSGGRHRSEREITITSQERGTVYTAIANESGNYSVVQILPGLYTMEFKAPGFQRLAQKDVAVSIDRSTRMDVQLVVGQVTEEISVTGAAPPLVTDRAEVSAALTSQQVVDLPTLNRNFTALQLLMPGAQKMSWQHATSENPQQGIQINTNGQRFGSNNFMIDGADNNDPVLGIIVVNPAIDSVSEFKYTTGNYDAEYAQAGGAVMQVETKTGTNSFHGSLFEFLQNNITNARNPFSEPNGPPPLRWNQFGGSFGGPIVRRTNCSSSLTTRERGAAPADRA